MANRTFQQFTYSLVPGLVVLTGKVAIGASGAPTLTVGQFNGIASISRTGTGAYTLTLQDTYVDYCHVDIVVVAAGAPTVLAAVNTVDVTSTKTITFTTNDFATGATPTDPANGSVLTFFITLANSTSRLG